MPKPPPLTGKGKPSELDELLYKQRKVTNESLESTRNMVHLLEETKEAGIKAIVAIDEQGEQIEHIESGLTKIHEDMIEAQRTLSHMERLTFCCCGLCHSFRNCQLPCRKNLGNEGGKTWKNNDDGKVVSGQPKRNDDAGSRITSGFISRITNDSKEDEMELNMQKVSSMIGNLKHMTQDLGAEIEYQNWNLTQQKQMMESDERQVKEANIISGQLLRKHQT